MSRADYHHSIRFGDGTLVNGRFAGYDTYDDWHLIPTSRPVISMPGIETKFVTIPGMDGALDLSDYLRKDRPAYGNRAGNFEFYVENDHEFWMTIYPKIVAAIHGKKFKMVLNEDDPDYYWEGRFTVDKYEPGDGHFSTVGISYQVGPWKRKIRKASEGMVWDNFNFEKDYDAFPNGYSAITVDAQHSEIMNVWSDGYAFPVEATCSSGTVTVIFGGETAEITQGATKKVGHAQYGMNPLYVTGNGTVSIDWRGGSL